MSLDVSKARIEQAADNNARWCDAVCRAHGIPGEFHEDLWLNRHQVPRFYPNAVTLAQTRAGTAQLAHIHDLIAEERLDSLAVKDSFCALDLAPLAFRPLFEAAWLWRALSLPKPDGAPAGIRWTTVHEPAELARWEAAWKGESADDPPSRLARIFLPSLLDDSTIAFIAAYRDEQIVAGAIANRTGDVVGLSNVFVLEDDTPGCWAGCVSTMMDTFPGLPLVGYERGDELTVAQSLGFEAVAPLRVWTYARP